MKGISLMEMGTIVPIVLALLLFFGSFVSAMKTIDAKNRQIDLLLSVVEIVDRVTEAGVLTEEGFKEAVKTLGETIPANFYICVTRYDDDDYSHCTLKGSKEYGLSETRFPKDVINDLGWKTYISSSFPIVYQETRDGVPFNDVHRLLVIVWVGA